MILLDENFPDDQCEQLTHWHLPFRKIGRDVAHCGIKDSEIIPLLHKIGHVTFFTQDRRFFYLAKCHPAYCFVLLDVRSDESAFNVRRFLRHPAFKSIAQRMGVAARLHADGVEVRKWKNKAVARFSWLR